MSLSGKIVLITGAGKGIGRSAALAFARAGAKVSLLTRTEEDFLSLRRELPADSLFMSGDVSDEETVKRVVSATIKNLTRLHVVVNNAGILTPKAPLTGVSVEDWDRSMAVNLRGPFLLFKHVLPVMAASKTGLFLNVSSGAGRRPAPGWGPYGVSKSALEMLTKQAAAEAEGTGVAVASVDPGGTRTRMRAAAYPDEDPSSLPHPDDVARFLVSVAQRMGEAALNGAELGFREWQKSNG